MGGDIPHREQAFVQLDRDQAFAIRGEAHPTAPSLVGIQDFISRPRREAPNFYGSIRAAGNDRMAVRRKRDSGHTRLVPPENGLLLVRGNLPQAEGRVPATGYQKTTVR